MQTGTGDRRHSIDPLSVVAHRPYPLPDAPWVMAQRWHDLLFAHWPLAADVVRPHLPRGLALDTFGGEAWVGVVPFRMSGVRLRGTPALPWLSAFPELNVRTYVERDGRPGVFFWSLDAANPIAVRLARAWFHLPYFDARMRCEKVGDALRYESVRTHRGAPQAHLSAEYGPTGPVAFARAGTLEHWLTERYCLVTSNRRGELLRAEIHHAPWPLQPAETELRENTMAAAAGLALAGPPASVLFARYLDVRCWTPVVVER
jgi:uncharacterized protein